MTMTHTDINRCVYMITKVKHREGTQQAWTHLTTLQTPRQHVVDHPTNRIQTPDNLFKVWTHWAFYQQRCTNMRQLITDRHTGAFNKGMDEAVHQRYGHTGSLY